MNLHRLAARAALAACAALSLAAAAQSATSDAPILIKAAAAQPASAIGTLELSTPGSIALDLENTRDAAAVEIVFDVAVGGVHADSIVDREPIQPRATAQHRFVQRADLAGATITLAAVTFADGSMWIDRRVLQRSPRVIEQ